jgi:hypothetical protein
VLQVGTAGDGVQDTGRVVVGDGSLQPGGRVGSLSDGPAAGAGAAVSTTP